MFIIWLFNLNELTFIDKETEILECTTCLLVSKDEKYGDIETNMDVTCKGKVLQFFFLLISK